MRHGTTWGERDATTRFQGFVSAEDFLQEACELTTDPRFESMEFFVADFLDITGHAIDMPTVREDLAAQALGGLATNARYKIVVVADDQGIKAFTEKMRAMYKGGGPDIFLFKTRAGATQWMAGQTSTPNFRDSRL
jgi:hypothetical protein